MIVAIWGEEKTLKTTFGLTFPKPLYHCDFDFGYERAAGRFSGQDIKSVAYPLPLEYKAKPRLYGVKEVWYKFLGDYHREVTGDKYISFSMDTFTQTWEMDRLCYLQELQEKQEPLNKGEKYRERLQPIEYGEPNARMRSIIYAARAKRKNLILTHYARDGYITQMNPVTFRKEDVRSGQLEMDGFKYIPGLVDLVIHSFLNKDGIPSGIITVSGLDLNMKGHVMEYPSYEKIINLMEMLKGGE